MLLRQNCSALSIKFAQKIDYKNNPEQQLHKTTCKKCQVMLGNYRENYSGLSTTTGCVLYRERRTTTSLLALLLKYLCPSNRYKSCKTFLTYKNIQLRHSPGFFYYSFFITWNCKEKKRETRWVQTGGGEGWGSGFLTKYSRTWKRFKELTFKLES